MGWFLFALVAVALIVVVRLYVLMRRPKNFPPGPNALVSTFAIFNGDMIGYLSDLVPVYGTVVGIFVGSQKMVMIHDVATAKEVFNQENLNQKVMSDDMRELLCFGGNFGIIGKLSGSTPQ